MGSQLHRFLEGNMGCLCLLEIEGGNVNIPSFSPSSTGFPLSHHIHKILDFTDELILSCGPLLAQRVCTRFLTVVLNK